jgi:hypothetical protein
VTNAALHQKKADAELAAAETEKQRASDKIDDSMKMASSELENLAKNPEFMNEMDRLD